MSTSILGPMCPCTNSQVNLSGHQGFNPQQSLEAFIEELIQQLQQFVSQINSGLEDSGHGGLDGEGGCAAMPPRFSPPMLEPPIGGSCGEPSGDVAGSGRSAAGSGNGSSGGSVPTVSSSEPAHAIAQNLEQTFGLTAAQAAGVLGNLQQESGLRGDINQGGATGDPSSNFADDNNNGWGLAQWGGARKQGEIAYAHQNGLNPGSLQANMGFMDQELNTDYSQTMSDIKSTTTTDQAALVWDRDYEQASDPEMSNRNQYAQRFLSEGL
ncbi:phage tail tip lysozyme [Paraburkholderia sp. SARCC-3016]|uniref:phage tail tip lysozyme n=1 Tax=Paraburkholderia sp. SARCC-3016 TaxID=3058611 RepID=UPI002808DA0E|nr:phage tail tip lysozyme [Paraburkholderia sp. SARCC-3016]MDQ7982550.1 phage tail tip lysozyme [Paraburkholderia sp. SARCC-3016]